MPPTNEEILDYLFAHPPRCIRDFRTSLVDENLSSEYLYSSFDLACPCGSSEFQVLGHSWWNTDREESVFVSPLLARCESCSTTREVFDIKYHGYDGELNDECFSGRGEGEPHEYSCSECSGKTFTINVYFDFTEDIFEAEFEEAKGRECDLFHWFQFNGTCTSCSEKQLICDYECA